MQVTPELGWVGGSKRSHDDDSCSRHGVRACFSVPLMADLIIVTTQALALAPLFLAAALLPLGPAAHARSTRMQQPPRDQQVGLPVLHHPFNIVS